MFVGGAVGEIGRLARGKVPRKGPTCLRNGMILIEVGYSNSVDAICCLKLGKSGGKWTQCKGNLVPLNAKEIGDGRAHNLKERRPFGDEIERE